VLTFKQYLDEQYKGSSRYKHDDGGRTTVFSSKVAGANLDIIHNRTNTGNLQTDFKVNDSFSKRTARGPKKTKLERVGHAVIKRAIDHITDYVGKTKPTSFEVSGNDKRKHELYGMVIRKVAKKFADRNPKIVSTDKMHQIIFQDQQKKQKA